MSAGGVDIFEIQILKVGGKILFQFLCIFTNIVSKKLDIPIIKIRALSSHVMRFVPSHDQVLNITFKLFDLCFIFIMNSYFRLLRQKLRIADSPDSENT